MTEDTTKFALLGVGGFVAPRHLQAIHDVNGSLLAACDPKDSVGIIDKYFPDAAFFTEFERFDRFLEKRKRNAEARVKYVSICTPNYLHDAHVRFALRLGADAICEKPLVINPWNLDQLELLEQETKQTVYSILQMRLLGTLAAERERLSSLPSSEVELTYVTRRGRWYHTSWKGQEDKSGGLVMNIGIHLFDMLIWLFGPCSHAEVHVRNNDRASGILQLERARVRWFLSVNGEDLPEASRAAGKTFHRTLRSNGQDVEFSDGFTDLHTQSYKKIIAGGGFRISDTRPAIELGYRIRTAPVSPSRVECHPRVASLGI